MNYIKPYIIYEANAWNSGSKITKALWHGEQAPVRRRSIKTQEADIKKKFGSGASFTHPNFELPQMWYFSSSKKVASYFADGDTSRIGRYSILIERPFYLSPVDGLPVSYADVRSRLDILPADDSKKILAFARKYHGKKWDGELSIDVVAAWAETTGRYDGVVSELLDEADDMTITSTTYIVFGKDQFRKVTLNN